MNEMLMGLFAMTALFIIPAIIGLIAIVLWFRNRNRLYQSIDHAVEQGAPSETINRLVAMTEKKPVKELPKRKQYYVTGIFFTAFGIAFSIIYLLGVNNNVIYPAAFATFLGLAHIVNAAFILKDNDTDSE